MRKSTEIKFTEQGAELNFNNFVTDIYNTSQKILVNASCRRQPSRLYPTRGTKLKHLALSGALTNYTTALHQGNFAADDTKLFVNSFYDEKEGDAIERLQMLPYGTPGSTNTLLTVDFEVQTRAGLQNKNT